jgi:hypothetical protein
LLLIDVEDELLGMSIIDASIYIPERLIKEIERRGFNVTDLIISTLGKNIDLKTVVEARIELAEKYFAEAKEYVGRGDAVQASEKMYKVVEECIKALAQHYNMPEHEVAVKEGRWWTQLLGKAARGLSRTLNEPKITDVWARAYDIHVWGFHESKYTIEDINEDIKHIDWLLNYVKQKVASNKQ